MGLNARSFHTSAHTSILLAIAIVFVFSITVYTHAQDAGTGASTDATASTDVSAQPTDTSVSSTGDTSQGSVDTSSGAPDANSNPQAPPSDTGSANTSDAGNATPTISNDFANDVAQAQVDADTQAQISILPNEYQGAGDVSITPEDNTVVIDETPIVDTSQDATLISSSVVPDALPIDASVVNNVSTAGNLSATDVQIIEQAAQDQATAPSSDTSAGASGVDTTPSSDTSSTGASPDQSAPTP